MFSYFLLLMIVGSHVHVIVTDARTNGVLKWLALYKSFDISSTLYVGLVCNGCGLSH